MVNKIIYASDLDRTLIFSKRFIDEHPTDASYKPVEYKGVQIISYMADSVKDGLNHLRNNDKVTFIPVTTRSLEEYSRVNLGFTPEYAIVANGGMILHNGKPLEDWENYIKNKINPMEIIDITNDIQELDSVNYQVKFIDNRYLFFKTDDKELFDKEIESLIVRYPEFTFTRQVKKCYAIPNHFSKQIALRWVWHKLNKPFIIASGDSELDLPMLTLANKAIIPSHGSLIKDGFVTDGTFVDGGITSPLKTFDIVNNKVNN